MDIKDFILVAGGTLIAMVVAHGFWIAYRAKREPLRMDIVPDLIPDDVDDMERLRGELPNGGARVIQKRLAPSQADLALEPPLLSEEFEATVVADEGPARPQPVEPTLTADTQQTFKPTVHQAPPRRRDREAGLRARLSTGEVSTAVNDKPAVNDELPLEPAESVARVAGVQLDLDPANDSSSTSKPTNATQTQRNGTRVRADRPSADRLRTERRTAREQSSAPALEREVEELLVLHLVAPKGEQFQGEPLINALRAQGLRFGEMNIFHRIDPATKAKQFSVANIVEPGAFDMADLDALKTVGMSFFLQLPGPDQAMDAFDDMLMTARNVAVELGGEVRDENLSMLTRQGAEHMRQRISDFARRRLSKRA